MVQMFFESVKSEVRDIRKEVNDLKESLTFSQKDIEKAKVNIKNIEPKVTKIAGDISGGVSSCQPLANIKCSNCVSRCFMIFLNLVAR